MFSSKTFNVEPSNIIVNTEKVYDRVETVQQMWGGGGVLYCCGGSRFFSFYPSRGFPRYTIVTSVLPYTAETAGNRCALGSPRNATPRNSNPLSNANVLSSMSRITRILSPICEQTIPQPVLQAVRGRAFKEHLN